MKPVDKKTFDAYIGTFTPPLTVVVHVGDFAINEFFNDSDGDMQATRVRPNPELPKHRQPPPSWFIPAEYECEEA